MMEQKHGQQLGVEPLLLRASTNNWRLSKSDDTERWMNAQDAPTRVKTRNGSHKCKNMDGTVGWCAAFGARGPEFDLR